MQQSDYHRLEAMDICLVLWLDVSEIRVCEWTKHGIDFDCRRGTAVGCATVSDIVLVIVHFILYI